VGETPVPSLAPMLKQVSPAVVNIATKVNVPSQRNPLFNDPFFRRFFDIPDQPSTREAQSAGSGVIVDAQNGYILTNAHVIENATEVTVTLQDERTFKAEIVGTDKPSDVAVLKIDGKSLTQIAFADSSLTEVGDFVVAIGNPFGLQHTVTSGIVSALGRAGINPGGRGEAYEDFIQTDAAINPGNSGGALVNLGGELVGINSAILSGSGGNIGIGFAIPANMARSVMDQLVKYGSVKRGRLGVSIRSLSPAIAENLGIKAGTTGALVAEVLDGSPAAKAGIQAGDVITAVNGKSIRSDSELRNAIGLLRVGDRVNLDVLRDGRTRRVSTQVGESEATEVKQAEEVHPVFEGAELADAGNNGGVVVRAVAPRSPAAIRGLRQDDVIVGAGRVRIANLAQLRTVVKDARAFALQIRRGNATLVLVVE
jgi:Do/DeqQ family serine protease